MGEDLADGLLPDIRGEDLADLLGEPDMETALDRLLKGSATGLSGFSSRI